MGSDEIIYWLVDIFSFWVYHAKNSKRFVILYSNQKFSN